jgi:putative nucleotidyltransferase with HDIG domain
MMNREEALKLLKQNVKNKNLLKHMYAVEAIMGALADRFNQDRELWAMTGLLHDLDYDQTQDDPARHSLVGGQLLAELGFPEELVYAVKAHNDYHGLERKSLIDQALYAADPVSGLIVAAALIHKEKKLAAIDTEFILKRFGEKAFARGANREQINCCSELGLSLEEFLELSLNGMKKISFELGL